MEHVEKKSIKKAFYRLGSIKGFKEEGTARYAGNGLNVHNTLFLSRPNGLEPHYFTGHKGIGEKSTATLTLLERTINNVPAWRVG